MLTRGEQDMYGPCIVHLDQQTHVHSRPADNVNLLQHLPESTYGPVLVTLNPPAEPARGTVAARFQYDHPILNTEVSLPISAMPI